MPGWAGDWGPQRILDSDSPDNLYRNLQCASWDSETGPVGNVSWDHTCPLSTTLYMCWDLTCMEIQWPVLPLRISLLWMLLASHMSSRSFQEAYVIRKKRSRESFLLLCMIFFLIIIGSIIVHITMTFYLMYMVVEVLCVEEPLSWDSKSTCFWDGIWT